METHLIQLLLPLRDDQGRPFPASVFASIREELTERFGGVTAYSRAPADGVWQEEGGAVERDQIVILEVMVEHLDRDWWREYRERVRRAFRQDELVVRALPMERL